MRSCRIRERLLASSIPVAGVYVSGEGNVEVSYTREITEQERAIAFADINLEPESIELDKTYAILQMRKKSQSALDGTKSEAFAVDRALALIMLREINGLRTWLRDFKAAVAAATSLANLQSRVAALPNTPDYTQQQLMDAIKAKLADGSADGA